MEAGDVGAFGRKLRGDGELRDRAAIAAFDEVEARRRHPVLRARRVEVERALARRTWEYPACAVRLAKDTVALAAGYPTEDAEALADWSARVALCVSRDGYKQAILAGPEQVRSELQQALALVGVELVTTVASKGWLSSLLKR